MPYTLVSISWFYPLLNIFFVWKRSSDANNNTNLTHLEDMKNLAQ